MFPLRSAALLCLTTLLFGCGPGRNTFAPPCPTARLIPALADITRFAGPGPTHDVTDLILQARVIAVNGSCEAGDNPAVLPAKVKVSVTVQRGPAMQGREADVPIFLAVTEGETVRDKRVFAVHLAFPPNVDRLTITSPDIDLDLPVSSTTTGASYGVIAGFQLTPEELAANRRSGG
jgi:hypothetical protein